LVRGRYKARTC